MEQVDKKILAKYHPSRCINFFTKKSVVTVCTNKDITNNNTLKVLILIANKKPHCSFEYVLLYLCIPSYF